MFAMDKSCLAAALLFCLSNALGAVYLHTFHSRGHFDLNSYKEFDTAYIQQEWTWRESHRPLEIAAGVFNAVAWFCFCIPILQVAWIQSAQGTKSLGLHVAVAMLAIGGAMMEFLSYLIFLGISNALEWVATDFNLNTWVDGGTSEDNVGWKSLELFHTASRGMLLWVGAVEWLYLGGIFALLFWSIRQNQYARLFSMRWARFGLALAFLCLLDFCADLLRYQSWNTFAKVAGYLTILNNVILFPTWVVWLGRQLPEAREQAEKSHTAMKSSTVIGSPDTIENMFSDTISFSERSTPSRSPSKAPSTTPSHSSASRFGSSVRPQQPPRVIAF